MNRFRVLSIFAAVVLTGCASPTPQHGSNPGGCVTHHEMPPLQLTAADKRLLASVSSKPRTALDYYMLLPKSYFDIMPDSAERRVTYIESKTLSDDYLHASHSFECDGGSFQVTLKLYRKPGQTLVAIQSFRSEVIFDDGKPTEGEPSVRIARPSLWRYEDGHWIRQPDDAVPRISARRVLKKYHHDWDADRKYTDQQKFIWLEYKLSPAASDIRIIGRENFQPDVYEYARLQWRDGRFSFK